MAHPVTAPAIQRAHRLLEQRVLPRVRSGAIPFQVEATEETFEPLPYHAAVSSPRAPFAIGSKWGRPWHTRWFRARATVPAHLAGVDLVAHFDLGFTGRGDGFQVEGLAWVDGSVVHAIQPDRRIVHLGTHQAGDDIEVWIEAAATPIIAGHEFGYGPTEFGDPDTAPAIPLYTLRTAELAAHHADMESFAVDLHTAVDLAVDLSHDSPQRARLFAALERCDVAFDVNDPYGTVAVAHRELRAGLSFGPGPTSHTVTAVGHAHLDTAWLWPLRETRRKARRTFANAVHLLGRNPGMVYCHSQARHYAWVEQDDPALFSRVRALVEAGQWEPIGGMWVETDLNLPSGESLLRQLVQGQRAFESWFDRRSSVAFLPDDFGYPGTIPQIVAHAGCTSFFTQKLSWNETDRFPHHSFWWEGIDGTAVFAHFSPIDTYNALMTPSQLRFAERNFADHAGATQSLVLYGHGDGGGGPTQAMVDRARLATGIENVPRVRFGTVEGFFDAARSEYGAAAPRWVGEMYFEKHRGTYSTQLGTKQGNRACERALHELELWSATANLRIDGVDDLWRRVLTQQFHDIIPGSSIAWVHRDAEQDQAAVVTECESYVADLLAPAAAPSDRMAQHWIANPAPVRLAGVVDTGTGRAWCDVDAFSFGESAPRPADVAAVVASESDGERTMSNGLVTIVIDAHGRLRSVVGHGRDIIPPGSTARLEMRRDTPAEYDAWDIDRTDADAPPLDALEHVSTEWGERDDLVATVLSTWRTASSTITVAYRLAAGARRLDIDLDADWHESERRLQWVLPVDLLARDAVCGTQFGHVRRARHTNTSWDHARFEVCAHRWVAVSEPGFGAAVLADGPRGWDVRGDALRLTVLRAPRFPDPAADLGRQHISWSIMALPGDPILAGIEDEAALMAHPARLLDGPPAHPPLGLSLRVPGALVSAVKPADDGSGDLIVRIWETRGARAHGRLTVSSFGDSPTVTACNALEEPVAPPVDGGAIVLRPFEIRTLRLSR